MSYHISSYRQSPPPYAGPTTDVPFPGWGIQPHAAGPARIGVGLGASARHEAHCKHVRRLRHLRHLCVGQTGSTPVDGTNCAAARQEALATNAVAAAAACDAETEAAGAPWWLWLAVPLALGGGLLLAYDQGWLGGSKALPAAA